MWKWSSRPRTTVNQYLWFDISIKSFTVSKIKFRWILLMCPPPSRGLHEDLFSRLHIYAAIIVHQVQLTGWNREKVGDDLYKVKKIMQGELNIVINDDLRGYPKIVNKVSQRSLRTNERSIRYGEDLYVSDVTAICLSL